MEQVGYLKISVQAPGSLEEERDQCSCDYSEKVFWVCKAGGME